MTIRSEGLKPSVSASFTTHGQFVACMPLQSILYPKGTQLCLSRLSFKYSRFGCVLQGYIATPYQSLIVQILWKSDAEIDVG